MKVIQLLVFININIISILGKPVSWMMITPSITPRKMNIGANNPALRLYKFDTDTGQVINVFCFTKALL